MSYRVRKRKAGNVIFEKETSVVIELPLEESEVRAICRKLNLGAGFGGWTPLFFAKTIAREKDLNYK